MFCTTWGLDRNFVVVPTSIKQEKLLEWLVTSVVKIVQTLAIFLKLNIKIFTERVNEKGHRKIINYQR